MSGKIQICLMFAIRWTRLQGAGTLIGEDQKTRRMFVFSWTGHGSDSTETWRAQPPGVLYATDERVCTPGSIKPQSSLSSRL